MELYEAMSTLRAVRRLRPDPIPEDALQRVLTAATWAPTGGNRQPWRIVAVKDPTKKQALEDLYRPYWEGYIVTYRKHMETMPADERATSARAIDAGTHLATHMHEVPVIAVFCYNPDDDDHRQGSASAISGRRRLGVSGGAEPAARVPQRRARLRTNDPALSRRADGA